jgi:hypothetical protein
MLTRYVRRHQQRNNTLAHIGTCSQHTGALYGAVDQQLTKC